MSFFQRAFTLNTLSLFFIVLSLATSVLSSPLFGLGGTKPVKPTDDPFYIPPTGYENTAPGTILSSRKIALPVAAWGLVPLNVANAYQLLYRTTDSLGNPQASVTTVIVPHKADVRKVLSFQIAEDSASPNCAPSYTLQEGSGFLNAGSSTIEILFIVAALNQGWIVNSPDYEGPHAAYTSGIQAGQATLDSIRAALASGKVTGISPSAQYQMWGYSGGSIASEWAAELAPTYAPELKFAGMAVGGLVPKLESALRSTNGSLFSGLSIAATLGLMAGYPQHAPLLESLLVPEKADKFKKGTTLCLGNLLIEYAFQDVYSYFKDGEAILQVPEFRSVLEKTGIMGRRSTPQMPVFAYKAIGDQISPVNETDALIDQLCSQGANIRYVRDTVGEHATGQITGAGDALQFLKDRFDGVPAATGCSTATVSFDILGGSARKFFGGVTVEILRAILGLPIGEVAKVL